MGLFDKLFGRGGDDEDAEPSSEDEETFNVTVVDGRVDGQPTIIRDVQVSQQVRVFRDGVEVTDPAEQDALLHEKAGMVREKLEDANLPEEVGAMVTDALRSALGDAWDEPAKPAGSTLRQSVGARPASESPPPAPTAAPAEGASSPGSGAAAEPPATGDDAGIEAPEAPPPPEAPSGY